MKVSLNWLKDYVKFDMPDRDYAELMTSTGTKVETIEKLGEDIENVVAGKIDSVTPHPDSDHLVICMVDVGGEKPLQIVTGAQNVHAGDFVPVCLNGAKLPGGKVIKSGKLRGVISEGMLCSLSELGLTVHDFPYAIEDGIFIMREPCKPGDDIRDVLSLRDTVVDFELTFNRPDCLALLGIAPDTAASPAPSPLWGRARLRACGIRPINNIVDITNYVMLEYGQPMHAFDASYISSGSIVIRKAAAGEKITTLDGNVRELTTDMLCIADGEKPVALAGIMGGENSEITDKTVTVIFESANFSRSSIRRTSRAVGLRTDASRRYEKGIPPCTTMPALDRACELVELLGAGTVIDGTIDVCNTDIGERTVDFDYQKINALLGIALSETEMRALLEKLFFRFDGDGRMIVPPYRGDIVNTADIAEEVVRLYGFDKIPATRFAGCVTEGGESAYQKFCTRLNAVMTGLGFYETYTYSFISPKLYDKLALASDDPLRDGIRLLNPLGDDTSVMRTTAVGSLLGALAYNRSHRIPSCALFENATIYAKPDASTPSDLFSNEEKQLVCGFYGSGDFYDLKGYIAALADTLHIDALRFEAEASVPYFHPGRCAAVYAGKALLGRFGQLHPAVCDNFELPGDVYAAVLSTKALFAAAQTEWEYRPLPVYPAVERDLALVMDVATEAGVVEDAIRSYAGKSLCGVTVFDVYTGKGVADGKKSVAFRLSFRLPDKTMNDSEVDAAVTKILRRLESEKGITLRA